MENPKKLRQLNFAGDPNLGLYGFASDRYCILGYRAKMDVLHVPIINASLLNTGFLGIFATGNSHGIVVSSLAEKHEVDDIRKRLRKIGSIDIMVLDSQFTAIGNLVLMNDNGIVISPFLRNHKTEIEKFFSLPCEVTTIAGLDVVGSLAIATNKGCIVHPQTRKREMKLIEKILDVEVGVGTVNYGSPFPGAGLIANSSGMVASTLSSGPELGNAMHVLGFD